ncbi:hypothetical protein LAV60_15455 [Clostridium sporogenes]|uniref:hypothetical protein n=1 Tax=Clostridium sporogenes TaxID=1509 RepID=UPI002237943A|nr:hypothetical protein [Clostridium sporogenes]MCW6094567.1 hypothetical protein [Clostridium sporogenes]
MCKLNINDVIVIRYTTWDLKVNQKYVVADIKKDSKGNMCYYFKSYRKNAVSVIKCYVDDIDKELSNITYKELKQNNILPIFNQCNIFKWV